MAPFRHKVARVVVVLALVLAVAAIWVMVRRILIGRASPEVDGLLLPLLPIAVIVLALGLAGILIRNLVRLVMDRKRGILGSRLRTKLVFFFLILVLPPAGVLFYGSGAVITETVDGMLETPVEDITRFSKAIVDDWTDFLQARSLDQADRIAREVRGNNYLEEDRLPRLERMLEQWMDREELNLILVTSGEETVARSIDSTVDFEGGETTEPASIRDAVVQVLENGESITRLDYLGSGLIAQALTPIYGRPGEIDEPLGVVAVGIFLPERLADRLSEISSANEEFRQFEARRDELVAAYLSLLALIFLASVFVATWMGFYLSRRISEPIQELAAATREIAAGNLGVRVESRVGDEAGVLVEAFNDMAAQLQESQEVITRSTAELRRSNRALDERRRYIETLLSNLSTGVISLDGQGRVTTVNPAAEAILGCRVRTGDRVRTRLDVAGLEAMRDLIDEVEGRAGVEVRRDMTLTRGGETLSVAVQASSLPATAGDSGTLVMLEDLTDLFRAQKAAAWREVARRIAHEIKNPLTPIQLATQRLRKRFDGGGDDLEQILPEATDAIQREVAALKALVDEFSRFARMPEVSPEPVEFSEVVDSALALYRGLPGVRWELDTDPGVGVVEVDPEQMRRALINLIDNAVSAMNGEGTIRISTRPHGGPGTLHLEVADSGPGIPPGDRDKMFAPYFSTKGRGTGLGLAIVHRVVTDHRGTIRIEDNQPRGARFVIEIPG
jgi:two-component system nitrogen regulation sensor histidine kinase NtrY